LYLDHREGPVVSFKSHCGRTPSELKGDRKRQQQRQLCHCGSSSSRFGEEKNVFPHDVSNESRRYFENGEKKKTENNMRNFLLFTCTSGKWAQGKGARTLIPHT